MHFILNPASGKDIPIPDNYIDAIEIAKSDYFRWSAKSPSLMEMIYKQWRNPSFGVVFWYRLHQVDGCLNFLCKYKRRYYLKYYGIDLPPKVKIGWGFFIGHSNSLIFNETTIIGNNCNVSQTLTIGANNGTAAIIGDNVYIGPHVCLVENVMIGNEVTIGAGAVVTKDIPANCTAVGVPARVINKNSNGKYICKRWLISDKK